MSKISAVLARAGFALRASAELDDSRALGFAIFYYEFHVFVV
jgi:hypothetical protein